MSDGHFNRAFIQSSPLSSGLRMGRQQMKAKSVQVFSELLKERFPDLPDKEISSLADRFAARLSI